MSRIPMVEQYMTPVAKTIGPDQTLTTAKEYMRKLHVRQLAVAKSGKPVGIITERDIELYQALKKVGVPSLKVGDLMMASPMTAAPGTSLKDLAQGMSANPCGCVLVVDKALVVGIFTPVDALNALADLFNSEAWGGTLGR